MKTGFGAERPEHLQEDWPGQYKYFSHLEYAAGVPGVLFLITTVKENGEPNACFHAWSTFSGDGGGFFAVLSGLLQGSHTYANILRDREFCINFLDPAYIDACMATINLGEDVDEVTAVGLHPENAETVSAPRIAEAFLTYECRLHSVTDLSGQGISALIIGRVLHAVKDADHPNAGASFGDKGFMLYSHGAENAVTGEGSINLVLKLEQVKTL
ncbi:flavin reductase family protein [Breznakiella homolactica]|uniref:Flavin reductase n=1 Tax=Breznakiella homolactica TaxID=2798577 RepID=A0A7T7XJE0_9SPIR|nr:flavin reductase [Breznakiella homolactica]QQO07500.1 flavin reductase [Breznakiella homolactica]